MSRPFRSAQQVVNQSWAHQAHAGPSTLRSLQRSPPVILPEVVGQQRRAASFRGFAQTLKGFMPFLPQRKTESKPTNVATSSEVGTSDQSPVSVEGKEGKSIYDDVAPLEDTAKEKKRLDSRIEEFKWRIHPDYNKELKATSKAHAVSPRKLHLLAKQIKLLAIDEAIAQMRFSEKGHSTWIQRFLIKAKHEAIKIRGLKADKLVVSEAWIGKAPYDPMSRMYRGRGRVNGLHHPNSRLYIVLRHGISVQERTDRKIKKIIRNTKSSGVFRTDTPLRRKVISDWAW